MVITREINEEINLEKELDNKNEAVIIKPPIIGGWTDAETE